MEKKGLSTIVTTIIMIAIVIAAISIIWAVINGLINQKLGGTQACFGIFGKVTINPQYTCYNTTSGKFRFSISVEDIKIDSVLVSISGAGNTKSYKITDQNQTISGLTNYPNGTGIIVPGENSGLTYLSSDFATTPDSISIAPIINGNQCDVSDTLNEIESCSFFSS
jgi:flagellin-like protein